MNLLIQICGWTGVSFFIIAYCLLSGNYISSKHYSFHLLNIVGGIGLSINAFYYHNQSNMLVNVIWITIGLVSIIKNSSIVRNRKSSKLETK